MGGRKARGLNHITPIFGEEKKQPALFLFFLQKRGFLLALTEFLSCWKKAVLRNCFSFYPLFSCSSEGLKYGALEFGPKQFAVLAKPTSDVEIQYRTGTVRLQPIFPKNSIWRFLLNNTKTWHKNIRNIKYTMKPSAPPLPPILWDYQFLAALAILTRTILKNKMHSSIFFKSSWWNSSSSSNRPVQNS